MLKIVSLEENSHTPAEVTWLREEHIMLQLYVSLKNCIKQLHMVPTKNGCQSQKELCLLKTLEPSAFMASRNCEHVTRPTLCQCTAWNPLKKTQGISPAIFLHLAGLTNAQE
jgi:hypothetical protein